MMRNGGNGSFHPLGWAKAKTENRARGMADNHDLRKEASRRPEPRLKRKFIMDTPQPWTARFRYHRAANGSSIMVPDAQPRILPASFHSWFGWIGGRALRCAGCRERYGACRDLPPPKAGPDSTGFHRAWV